MYIYTHILLSLLCIIVKSTAYIYSWLCSSSNASFKALCDGLLELSRPWLVVAIFLIATLDWFISEPKTLLKLLDRCIQFQLWFAAPWSPWLFISRYTSVLIHLWVISWIRTIYLRNWIITELFWLCRSAHGIPEICVLADMITSLSYEGQTIIDATR